MAGAAERNLSPGEIAAVAAMIDAAVGVRRDGGRGSLPATPVGLWAKSAGKAGAIAASPATNLALVRAASDGAASHSTEASIGVVVARQEPVRRSWLGWLITCCWRGRSRATASVAAVAPAPFPDPASTATALTVDTKDHRRSSLAAFAANFDNLSPSALSDITLPAAGGVALTPSPASVPVVADPRAPRESRLYRCFCCFRARPVAESDLMVPIADASSASYGATETGS